MKRLLNLFIVVLSFCFIFSCKSNEDSNEIKYLGTMEFGMYPQTKVVDSLIITELNKITSTNSRGFIEYNNEYYVKNTDYYLVEPITWEVVKKGGEKYLYASEVLDSQVFMSDEYFKVDIYSYLTKPGVPENTRANSYEYSDLRQWLNNTFLNVAFSDDEQSKMIKYEYDGFSDLVYTLCSDDFSLLINKALKPTDYAKILCDVYDGKDGKEEFIGYTLYWLRNANKNVPYQVYSMNFDGIIYEFVDCYYCHIGVRPVIKINA